MRSLPQVTGQRFMEINKNNDIFKILSIQVSLNGLCFCILDRTSSKVLFFKRVDFDKQLDPVKLLGKIELQYEKEPTHYYNKVKVFVN